jgi:hypothetical protein
MAARAGEQAWRTGNFICESCHEWVHVTKGARIPECPNGHHTYYLRVDEPEGEPASKGHPRHGGAAAPESTRAALHSPKSAAQRKRRASTVPGSLGLSRVSQRKLSRPAARARVESHKPGKTR